MPLSAPVTILVSSYASRVHRAVGSVWSAARCVSVRSSHSLTIESKPEVTTRRSSNCSPVTASLCARGAW